MKASVIIPTKNPGMNFKQVLHSVLEQNFRDPFEILIIDSGSTDGTLDFIKEIDNKLLRLHSIPPATFGHGKTRNLGISMTTGEYVILLTHDAMPINNNWLSSLIAVADSDPDIAGVFGRHVAYPEADPFTIRDIENHFSGFDFKKVVYLDDQERYFKDEGYRQFLHFFSDNNALIRRSVWESYPYPDVNFAEDQIWAKEIIEAGFKKAYAPEAAVFHSHNYSLIERLQRSFDEAYAFNQLFGYQLCCSILSLLTSWLWITKNDFKFTIAQRVWRRYPLAVLRMPADNLMKITGHYLGTKGNQLPEKLKKYISWDNRLLLGLRRSN